MHKCTALFVVCMDFRLQSAYPEFAAENNLKDNYDLYSVAGTQKTFINEESKDLALKQIELSHKLHGMTDVYLFAHWDCGAYGGTAAFESDEQQRSTYLEDMQKAKQAILEKFPKINVHKYLANWDENSKINFEKID